MNTQCKTSLYLFVCSTNYFFVIRKNLRDYYWQNIPEGFPGGSVVQSLPATQATQARLLGEKGPLEWETAAHSSILFLENQESFLIVQVK